MKKVLFFSFATVIFTSLSLQAFSADQEPSPEEIVGREARSVLEQISRESERIVDQIQNIEPEKIERETKRIENQVQNFFKGFRKK